MELKTLLTRAENSLSDFLNKQVIEILRAYDEETVHPKNLVDLIIKYIDIYSILQDSKTRNILINAMKKHEAEQFARHLDIKKWENIHYKLTRKKFTKNMIKKSLDFFNIQFEIIQVGTNPDVEEIEPDRYLFQHQLDTVEKITNKLKTPPHKVLLHMPTGSGKTISSMRIVLLHLLENPNALVIWLAHNEELCEQAIKEFQRTWKVAGDRKIDTYRFFRNSNINPLDIKKGFISASLLKMLGSARKNNTFLSKLAQQTSLVIIDEAHQATAKTFSIIITELAASKNTKLLGLSATPGRKSKSSDLENRKLAKFFANQKIMLDTGKENPVTFLIKHGYLAKPKFNRLDTENNLTEKDLKKISADTDIPKTILEKISNSTKRNLIIINEITRLYKTHKKIIVFASSIEHARTISLILSARNYTSYYIISKTPGETRRQILHDYKNTDKPMVLCNYGILTTGFDAPKTSAIVIVRPTKSYVLYAQMVGRGIRGYKSGGNKTCEISTIVDKNINEFIEVTDIFTQWEKVWND